MPLLPVSFDLAKDWLQKQQKAQSQAVQMGAVNEDARQVISDLSTSLAELPASTGALLEQPTRPALPFVPPPVMSLGPEPVMEHEKAEERAVQRDGLVGRLEKHTQLRHLPRRKKRSLSPQNQKRASARMLELGVPPLKVRLLSVAYHNIMYRFYNTM